MTTVTAVRRELEAIWLALEELGWEWTEDRHGDPLIRPSPSNVDGDLLARQWQLDAMEKRLHRLRESIWDLDDYGRTQVAGVGTEIERLTVQLPFDNPYASLRNDYRSLEDKVSNQDSRLGAVEAETTRFAEGVRRGLVALTLVLFLALAAAPSMGWRRADLVLASIVVAIVWLSVWRWRA